MAASFESMHVDASCICGSDWVGACPGNRFERRSITFADKVEAVPVDPREPPAAVDPHDAFSQPLQARESRPTAQITEVAPPTLGSSLEPLDSGR